MKKCPFCAEETQDAAIKCRHCGSLLTEVPPSPVQVLVPPPNASLDEEIKRLLGAGKKVDALKLVREKRPTLGLSAIRAYVTAVEKGTDPERAVRAVPAKKPFWPASMMERVLTGVAIFFGLLFGV